MKPLRPAWQPEYACGHARIDHEHRSLVAHLNAIADAQEAQRDFRTVYALLSVLVQDCLAHFASEEKVLAACGYPDAEGHAQTHSQLAQKMTRLMREYAESDLMALEMIAALFYDAVVIHMLSDDRRFFPYLARLAR